LWSAVELSELAVKILDYARTQGRVITRDMVREHGASKTRSNPHSATWLRRGCSCDKVAVDRLGTGCPDQLVQLGRHSEPMPVVMTLPT
jgi:hypothetical protein